jgi:hypothetical protein
VAHSSIWDEGTLTCLVFCLGGAEGTFEVKARWESVRVGTNPGRELGVRSRVDSRQVDCGGFDES